MGARVGYPTSHECGELFRVVHPMLSAFFRVVFTPDLNNAAVV